MGKIRRKFDAHFKTRICETIRSGLSNINEVCREYQLSRSVVERWLSAYDEGSLNERGSSREKELERENERLKAKVGELTMQIDILKNRRLATTGEKRRFVDHHRGQFGSVSAACEAAGIPVSTYYYKGEEDSMTQAAADAELRDRIETVQAEFPFYGYRRVHEHLERHEGLTVNKKRLQRVMKEHGLRALIWRGFKVKTTDSDHEHGFAPNLLPGLTVDGPNQVWVADITYIRILTGFVYLAVVMDLFQRKVVGWALSQRINHKLCIAALEKAVTERRPAPGCIHHSDRGWQYASPDYRRYLLDHEIAASMSAKGYCYDNAFMESFFKTLKAEEVYLTEYETYEDVLDAVPTFIDEVYNTKRMHSSLGYLAPDEYEKLWSSGELKKLGINLAFRHFRRVE